MMRNWLLAALLATCASLPASMAQEKGVKPDTKPAKSKPAADQFMRVRKDDRGQPTSMDTAVVNYVLADGSKPDVQVDLIGAVHVGDKAYYDELNKLFESYDAVLYELVAPAGTRIPKDGRK
ncbi:MAG: hypothetical protein WEH44_06230, partial [Pirellulaceae bacterium]